VISAAAITKDPPIVWHHRGRGLCRQHGADHWGRLIRDRAGQSLALSLLDENNLTEITHRNIRGERLLACYNPLLEPERGRNRQALLKATGKELPKVAKQVVHPTQKPTKEAEIAAQGGEGAEALVRQASTCLH
jgi:hypothetical protein